MAKRKPVKKTRAVPKVWSGNNEIRHLLRIRMDLEPVFQSPKTSNTEAWNRVLKEFTQEFTLGENNFSFLFCYPHSSVYLFCSCMCV